MGIKNDSIGKDENHVGVFEAVRASIVNVYVKGLLVFESKMSLQFPNVFMLM